MITHAPQNAHRNQTGKAEVRYEPTAGIEQEIARMKKTCFPDVQSLAAVNNEKVACRLCAGETGDTPLARMVHAKGHLDSRPYHCGMSISIAHSAYF